MRISHLVMAAVAMAGFGAAAQAGPNLVVNGGFELTGPRGPNFEFDRDTTFPGWTSNGYNFGFAPGTADTVGSTTSQYGNLRLWGPGNGSANGMTAASPTGGNFIGADGAYQVAPIQQTLTGLVVAKDYLVSFDWAAAQQFGYNGVTTEKWDVSLGGQTISTAVFTNASHGFSGWMHETFRFTFDGANNTLSFLAVGTPNGLPPFSLLDGVSVAAVPEPATWALMLVGFGAVGFAARRRGNVVAA